MGSFAVDLHSLEESLSTFMEANEEVDGGMVFTTRLSIGTVQAYMEEFDRLANCNVLAEIEMNK